MVSPAKKVVVDSSVIVKWLNQDQEEHIEQADELLTACQQEKIQLYTPELAKYEVANALLKGKQLPPKSAKIALRALYKLPINYVADTEALAQKSYQLARLHRITYYDAVFVSLAQSLRGALVTDNPKHQGKVSSAKVIALSRYNQ